MIAGEGGRVTERRVGAFAGPPPLQNDDWFGTAATDFKETPAIRKGFEIEADHPGVGIADEVLQQITFVHIDLVAHGADLADAYQAMAHDVEEEGSGKQTALNHERNIPGDPFPLARPGVHKRKDAVVLYVDEPHAIGTPDPNPLSGCHFSQFGLVPGTFLAGFRKTARFDHDPGNASRCALFHRCRYKRGGNEDDRQIQRVGHGADGRVTGQSLDLAISGIDGVDSSPISGQKVFQDGVSALERIRRCADNGDTAGCKEKIHRFPIGSLGFPSVRE